MNEEKSKNELSEWLSTYGLITAERILERYQIHLKQDELREAMNDPKNIYHQVLQVPLKNVLNGIILQQARDYQLYAQKLLIDYLLSGETVKGPEAPGDNIRHELEEERTKLIEVNEEFHKEERNHQNLIAESQASLIKLMQNSQSEQDIDFDAAVTKYIEQVEAISEQLRAFRKRFYDIILRVIELIKLLPEYRQDYEQDERNRDLLYFDANIGEK